MKIVITAQGDNLDTKVDLRFGRAKNFIIFDTESDTYECIDNIQNLNAIQGAGIQAAQNVANTGAEAIITGSCGPKAFRVLSAASIKVYTGGADTVRECIEMFRNGKLKESTEANVPGHWM